MTVSENDAGDPIRWSFTKIKPDEFHWLAEVSPAGGDWRLQLEFLARRTG